jgi:hypothetical protein
MYNTIARSWFDKLTTNGFALLKGYNKKKNALYVTFKLALKWADYKIGTLACQACNQHSMENRDCVG